MLMDMGFTDFKKNDMLYDKHKGDIIMIVNDLS